jgi:hypothetical protein
MPSDPTGGLLLPTKGTWFVASGGRGKELNQHWGLVDQQFAVDLIVVDAEGRSHRSNGAKREHYLAWSRPVYAVAAGRVVRAVGTLKDCDIGYSDSENIDGNHVMLAHSNGTYSLYDHLKQGSLQVQFGDSISQGAAIGLIGNSGNSSQPHLHLQLQTTSDLDPTIAVSLPMLFKDFIANEAHIHMGELPGLSFVRRQSTLSSRDA